MYCYEVGYYSYEESPIYTLVCEKEYSQEQFDDLISDLYVRAYKAFSKKDRKYNERIEDLLKAVIKILLEEYRFTMPEIKSKFIPFGWASIINKSDWENNGDRDKKLQLITDKLNKR